MKIIKDLGGKGVTEAVKNVNNEIRNRLKGTNLYNQIQIDNILIKLDGTDNKSRLGANAILAVSLASAKTAALSRGIELYEYIGGISANVMPIPMFNILNGGKHANNNLNIQEFMIAPIGALNFKQAMRDGCRNIS